jgi:hypothetical protein
MYGVVVGKNGFIELHHECLKRMQLDRICSGKIRVWP